MKEGHTRHRLLKSLSELARKRLVRNAGWLLVGQVFGLALQSVYFVILAKLLGPSEYGILAGAFAFTGMVALYSSLGGGTVFLRYVSGHPEDFARYFGNILFSSAIMSGVLIVAMAASARFVVGPASAHLVLLAAIANCLFGQLTTEIGRVFQAYERLQITALINLSINALRTASIVLLSRFIPHATAFQWVEVVTAVSGIGAVMAVSLAIVHFGPPAFDLGLVRRHFFEGLGFSFAASTSSVYNDIDKTMLSHYGMNVGNGIYSMAYRMLDIATLPTFAVRDAALPRLFEHGHKGIAPAHAFGTRLLKRTLLVSGFTAIAMFVLAPLITVVLGPQFSEGVIAIRWLAVIPLFRAIHQISGSVLTGIGMQGTRTTAQVVAAAANFLFNLYLIPHFGWRGAAWASILTDGGLAVMNWSIVRHFVIHSNKAAALDSVITTDPSD